jgi:GT2 family glycosyltransferase
VPRSDAGAEPPVVALARSAMASGFAALSADDRSSALRWLERAHRLVPHDPNATLTLASALLDREPARAAALFEEVAGKFDIRSAWLGLTAARLRLTGPEDAAVPLAIVLSRYAFTADATSLAEQIDSRTGAVGWCGLWSDGRLERHAATPDRLLVLLDGKPVRGAALPAGWERGKTVEVRIGTTHLLGSPIQLAAIRRLDGCVEVSDGGISGWAWHPNDPDTSPELTLVYASAGLQQKIVAHDESVSVPHTGPLARPRAFHLTRAALLDATGPIHVRGPDGKDLLGSPLDPFADEAAHVAAALRLGQVYAADPAIPAVTGISIATPAARVEKCRAGKPGLIGAKRRTLLEIPPALRAGAAVPASPVGAEKRQREATVIIPMHNGGQVVLACLTSVLASIPTRTRVLVVDDGSSDPALIAALADLVRQHKISLIRHDRALGFPASANAGIRAARGRDVVLLNSDTLVPPNWLERLRAAAYAAPDVGTVTPLSNDASILSYPGEAGSNPRPDQTTTNRLDRLAERANGTGLTNIPVGVGFCLYLRRDCLNTVGLFRTDLFAQGYGEENDLCLRARHLGWRHVALTGLFVGHLGGTTFGDAAKHLRARNGRIVEQLHPGHDALIKDFVARDPLAEPRRRIDLLRWRERGRGWRRAVVLITHDDGGGVERRLRKAAAAYAADGCRPIVLRPATTAAGEPAIAVEQGIAGGFPNLIYAMPRELPALLRLLRASKPEFIEAHHFADYPPTVYDLVRQLGAPYDVHVHDYAWFCPRVSLVAASNRYCGEPDLPGCEACIADNGHFLKENITVADLRTRSAAFLSGARRVVVPSDDAGTRMRRHFDGLATTTVPHEDDAAIRRAAKPPATAPGRPRVCVVGAIGMHKGYEILLACARDAARRDLDLDFVVVGHTIDDARLMATDRVFVTGRFDPAEAVALIARQGTRLAFVPSVWPETWCLTLGDIWRAGLSAAVFDFGAPAERIKRTGGGFMLPSGLSPSAINNALIAAFRKAGH